MNVRAATLPPNSLLHKFVGDNDFLDCYVVESNRSVRDAAEIAMNQPGWVRLLMSLRNLIAAPFGLTVDNSSVDNKIGLFPVEVETENELIAGFNDKHLDFRISVLSEGGKIYFATWVHTHNIGGRLYLGAVMPFHILIVRNALRRVAA